jgi:hypothetical protein
VDRANKRIEIRIANLGDVNGGISGLFLLHLKEVPAREAWIHICLSPCCAPDQSVFLLHLKIYRRFLDWNRAAVLSQYELYSVKASPEVPTRDIHEWAKRRALLEKTYLEDTKFVLQTRTIEKH